MPRLWKAVAVACVIAVALAMLFVAGVVPFVLAPLVFVLLVVATAAVPARPAPSLPRPALLALRSSRRMPRASLPR